MSNFKGVEIVKGVVGPDANGPATSVSAILATGVAIADKLVLGTTYVITSLKQAEEVLGITAAYDTANDLVLHEHIADFYSRPKNANVPLHIMVVAVDDKTPVELIEDTGELYAKKLIKAGGGQIKQFALAYNVADDYTETLLDGLNAEIKAAIPKAQELYNWAYSTDRPCQIFLEGRGITSTVSALQNLRNIVSGSTVLEAHKVSIVIAQDWDYAESRTGKCQKYAGVGKFLGVIAAAEVNQSAGEVNTFDLSDAVKGKWLTAGLSNHLKVDDLEIHINDMTTKGYIYAGTYSTISGLRFNSDATCTPIRVDDDGNINEHTIYYGRTMDYAAIRLKGHFMQYVKSRIIVDPSLGKLPTAVRKDLENDSNRVVFGKMMSEGLISGGKTTIDPDSPVMPPENTMNVTFDIVPTAILDNINGTIYLRRKI
jgi:hypothetical protein